MTRKLYISLFLLKLLNDQLTGSQFSQVLMLNDINSRQLFSDFETTKQIPTFQPNHNPNSKSIKSRQNLNKRNIYTETPEKVQGE